MEQIYEGKKKKLLPLTFGSVCTSVTMTFCPFRSQLQFLFQVQGFVEAMH